jgi:rubrerythrin
MSDSIRYQENKDARRALDALLSKLSEQDEHRAVELIRKIVDYYEWCVREGLREKILQVFERPSAYLCPWCEKETLHYKTEKKLYCPKCGATVKHFPEW